MLEKALLVRPKKAAKMPTQEMDVAANKYSPSRTREKELLVQHPTKPLEAKSAAMPQKQSVKADLLAEMRNEFKQLKFAMSARLSEVNFANALHSNPVRLDLLHRLADMGISKKLGLKLVNRLEGEKTADSAFRKVQSILSKILPISDDPILEHGGVIALVGPTGVGKTTTIAKLAAKFILKHGPRHVALITTDNLSDCCPRAIDHLCTDFRCACQDGC